MGVEWEKLAPKKCQIKYVLRIKYFRFFFNCDIFCSQTAQNVCNKYKVGPF